jgi:hypothetical protein
MAPLTAVKIPLLIRPPDVGRVTDLKSADQYAADHFLADHFLGGASVVPLETSWTFPRLKFLKCDNFVFAIGSRRKQRQEHIIFETSKSNFGWTCR